MTDHTVAPADMTPGMHPVPLRRVVAAVLVAALIGLVLVPQAPVDWAFDLPEWLGPVRDGLLDAAYAWHDGLVALGLDQPFAWLRDLFRSFQPEDAAW